MAWERMREECGASVETRPLYSITYEDEGGEVEATVGEEGVVAIIAGDAFYIFEESGEARSVPVESATETVFFEDH